jgi:HD-like signal output (HDOD) protein
MKRILFVDDEQSVLDGLQNILRKRRKEWQMVFALGGNAALAEMERGAFDVIVSDMRMPGMDGAALLTLVRDRFPGTARIVLSGHSEREATVRALPVVHQFLHKPCDSEVLKSVIERTFHLQRMLQNEAIRTVIGKLDKLPSPPATYLELTQALSNAKTGVREVSEIVERDPAMSAKTLQLVNSAYFGLSRSATTIQQAVAYLGMEVMRGLSLGAHVFATAEGTALSASDLARIQKSSFSTAMLARRFCGTGAHADDAFTAGVVCDIGRIVIALGLPETFRQIEEVALATRRPRHVVEQELLGVSHAEVGAYLLGVWGIPIAVVETIAFHHTPGAVPEGSFDVLAALHVADALVDKAFSGAEARSSDGVDTEFLQAAGLAAELPRWLALAAEYLSAAPIAGDSAPARKVG